MELTRGFEAGRIRKPTVVTLGVFDGLHLGHQKIMSRLVERARATGHAATVVTFDPHPRAVLHPETAPPLLQTFQQKMRGIEQLGIDQTIMLSFTREFAMVSAEDFLVNLIFGQLDAREVYLGHGFAFGRDREGRFDLLEKVAKRMGRIAIEVPEVLLRGRRVSSTMIRRLLFAGRVNLARRMLGRPYSIESRVVEGRRIAKTQLNYATANLKPHNYVLPADGVYVSLTRIEGRWHRSLTNIGHKPTFGGDPDVTVETHVIDFDRALYGEEIGVRFLHRLRGETRFESVEALRAQIASDHSRAVGYFKRYRVRNNLDFVRE